MGKKNEFTVKYKKEEKIVLEEENSKNRFLLFWRRRKKDIIKFILLLLLCLILISVGIAFSLFRGSNDYDITYIVGDETVDTNDDPDIDDDDIKDELLGEVARADGVVLLVETFMSGQGDVISYYTDGTSVVVKADGKIYRVSTNDKGEYGVNKNGKIDNNAKKILVTSTTTTLSEGVVVTSYSDGTARVEYKGNVIFVRDSNNIELYDGNLFNKVNPSGVALSNDVFKLSNNFVNNFTDKTTLVTIGGKKYISNKNVNVSVNGDVVSYDRNNMFEAISEKTYNDGNTITHFSNGSAIITDKDGNNFYVRKSGHLVLKNKELYEIIPNEKANSRRDVKCSDGKKVTYFDNAVGIVIDKNGNRYYVEDSDEIIYDNNKNINSSYNYSSLVSERITEDGEKAYNFDNGKSQVMNDDGSSYIVDTDTLKFRPITEEEPEEEVEDDKTEAPDIIDYGEGIVISEAEHIYNDFKNIENTKFTIKNNNNQSRTLRITIEEVLDYRKYNINRLEPKFVKFQATVGDSYVPASFLTKNTWVDSDNNVNYVIYDGVIGARAKVDVVVALYIDYSVLDNSHQNKGFIGTINIYVEAFDE